MAFDQEVYEYPYKENIMTNRNNNTVYFLAGLLFGSLAGAAASLLMTPQSGKATRDQIQAMGIDLRDGAAETVDNAVAEIRLKSQQISSDVREKADELQQRGQTMLDEQREHLSTFVEGKNKKEIEVSA
jgi:gas vesicle protein